MNEDLRKNTALFAEQCQHQCHQIGLLAHAVDLTLDRPFAPETKARLMSRNLALVLEDINQLLPYLMLLAEGQAMAEGALVEDASER